MDGYFPYILKKKHPEGVALKLLDKLDTPYGNMPSSQFQDLGSLDQAKVSPMGK